MVTPSTGIYCKYDGEQSLTGDQDDHAIYYFVNKLSFKAYLILSACQRIVFIFRIIKND